MNPADAPTADRPIEDALSFARRLEALARMSAALTEVDDEEWLYQAASDHILEVIPVERASIGLLSGDGSRFQIRGLHGEVGAAGPAPGDVADADGWALHEVARSRRELYSPHLDETGLTDLARLRQNGFGCALIVPLVAGDITIGTLNLARSRDDGFSSDEMRLLRHAAQLLAVAIMSVRRLVTATNAERASAVAHELAAHRVREIESLNRVFRILNDTEAIEDRVERLACELTTLEGVDHCELALLSDDGALLSVGRSGNRAAGLLLRRAVDRRGPVWDGETELDGSWTAQKLAVPILVHQRAIGSLALIATGPRTFGASLGVLAETVAAQVANALDRDRMMVELRRAAEAADAASRTRSRFLANMSHELRTPMNGVIGMTALLEGTRLSDQQRMYLETIRVSGEAQVAVINHILDFSKIEAGRLELQTAPFVLRSCVEEALDMAAAALGAKPVDLVYEIDPALPPSYEGDANRLRQVLVNLLSNAVKFTEAGEIELRVEDLDSGTTPAGRPRSGGRRLRISVRDTGIGIPADRAGSLFEPFTQVSSPSNQGGSGLGLAISRQLVELMAGTIALTSVEGRGSTFTVDLTLPEAEPDPARTEPTRADPAQAQPQLAGRRVLLVMANPTNRGILDRLMTGWGMTVDGVTSIAAARSRLDQPRLAVVDVAVVDGRARQDDPTGWGQLSARLAVPVVKLRALGDPAGDDALLNGGVRVTRPVKPAALAAGLHRALGLGREVVVSQPAWAPAPGTSPLGTRHPLRVLVAEDNRVNQTVASLLLERLGYQAVIVADGLAAVAAATSDDGYDLILMDLKMPGLNGIEAARQILATASPRPRIVAMTADTIALVRSGCLEAGMDGFITKPVRIEALVATLETTVATQGIESDDVIDEMAAASPPISPISPISPRSPTSPRRAEPDDMVDETALATLAELVGHNPAAVAEIVDAFVVDTPELLREIRLGCARGAPEQVAAAAHPLVSSSATVGARSLSSQAAALERVARAGQLPSAAALAILSATAEHSLGHLRQWLAAQFRPLPAVGQPR